MPSIQIRPSNSPQVNDLKQRVITCLNRLADRDTLSLAASELDSIALNLSPDTFSLFINCLQSTDSSARPPVRKHCVSLLSILTRLHGDSLSPHLSKMVATVLRRLRDPETSVRAACVSASTDMTTNIPRLPFSIIGPLIETLIHDCDPNAQIGSAVCLAAAVNAADEADVEQLQKALPRIGKLLKSDGFKAKPELLGAIGSVIGAVNGRNSDKAVLDWLLPNVLEFLSSEDWRARKASAETMARVAIAEVELAPLYKKACLPILERRRFDKVKLVRDTMNHTLGLWKQLEVDSTESISSTSQSASSGKRKNKLKHYKVAVNSKLNDVNEKDIKEVADSREKQNQAKLSFNKVKENGPNNKSQAFQSNDAEEELTLIRNQITEIEKQQSSLLHLLQKFTESSQNGMQSLARRVRGLETSLSVISTHLIVSRTITRNGIHTRNKPCLHNWEGEKRPNAHFFYLRDSKYFKSFSLLKLRFIDHREEKNIHAL